ncbi:MAG: type IV secretion system DNA-binding domain-containing protein [Patescibacteria group bacterium]
MDGQTQGQGNDICYFAMTNFRGQNRKFGIRIDDRRKHMYFIGKTGMGKSTTLENMIIQDIRAGRGVGVVDPHGDLAEKILDYIPSHRINDVIYFNPADIDYPIAFNILENVDPRYKHLVASGLMGVFTKIWANVWSARMEYILNNCILALLDSPGNTLLGINRILVDKEYRHKIVSRIIDPVVRSFWVNEYANYNDRFRTEAIAPIQNKVGQFLSTAIVRNIVGQAQSTIDMREIMDTKKILILNLAKGRIGEDNSSLLGAMMITKLQLAVMSRVDIPEHERNDFFLYVDEFQNFATTSFSDILSEARKYRLSLIMAHQYIEQLEEEVAAAVFGNVGTIVCFRVGAADAEELVKEFTPYFTEEDLVNLTKYDIYLRLMINGVASKPFSATSLPPLRRDEMTGNRDKVIAVSRERYTTPRAGVEEKIIKWSGIEDMYAITAEMDNIAGVTNGEQRYRESPPPSPPAPIKKETTKSKGPEPKDATCDNCGRGALITFIPDEKRNVFCKSCLKKFRQGLIDVTTLKKRNIPEVYEKISTPPSTLTTEERKSLPQGPNKSLHDTAQAPRLDESQIDTESEVLRHYRTPPPLRDTTNSRPVPHELSLRDVLHAKPILFQKKPHDDNHAISRPQRTKRAPKAPITHPPPSPEETPKPRHYFIKGVPPQTVVPL